MTEGVDYSWGRPDPAELYRLGKRFAVRYVSYDRTGKNLTKAEADRLHAAGLATVTNWEHSHLDQLGGYSRGVEHAREADRLHRACGGPPDRPIYFSTDFDASPAQLATCYDYLRGCADVLGWDRVGVYGGIRTIDHMADRGVRWLWQTYAWSAGQWHPATDLRQYRNGVRLAGGEVDLNKAMTSDFGQWGVAVATPHENWKYRGYDYVNTSAEQPTTKDHQAAKAHEYSWRLWKAHPRDRELMEAILAAVTGGDQGAILERIDTVAGELSAEFAEMANRYEAMLETAQTEREAILTALATVPAEVRAELGDRDGEAVEAAVRRVLERIHVTVAPADGD